MSRRLLYLTQYYSPPTHAGATRHYAHTHHLAQRGYDVTLITSFVKNSLRIIPPEYLGKRIVQETDGTLRIYKVYAYPHYGSDFTSRMRNYLSFMFYAMLAGLRAPSCDVVYASSPPLFSGLAGYLLSRIKRAAFVLEVRDLWPQAAVTMGVLKNRLLIWLAEWLARFLYRRAERVVAVTRGIRDAIIAEGIPASKVELITNGVDRDLFVPAPAQDVSALRDELGWDGKFVALYVGTLARSDGLETIVNAARHVGPAPDVQFVFLGDGEAKPQLTRLAQELRLSNVTFLDSQPKGRVPLYIQAADLCLLPVRKESFYGMVLPNKLFDYLGAGAPIIASVPPGEIQEVVQASEAGVVVEGGHAEALARTLLDLKERPHRLKTMGEDGRRYVLQHYERRRLADRLVDVLDEVNLARRSPRRAPKLRTPTGAAAVKRLLDVIGAAAGLTLLSPLFLVIALLIRLDSAGPVQFRQPRLGRNARPFEIYKFRSMYATPQAAKRTGALDKDDALITRVGRFLRATSLDELPQLINVLKGDMSLVGPRPAFLSHLERYNEFQLQRLAVRPGMTGWAQVNGRNGLPWDEKIKADVWYIHNYSPLLDLKIMFRTLGAVLGRRRVYAPPRAADHPARRPAGSGRGARARNRDE